MEQLLCICLFFRFCLLDGVSFIVSFGYLSEARKSQKGILNLMKVSDLPDKDLWKLAEVTYESESEEGASGDRGEVHSETSDDDDEITGEPAPKKLKHDDNASFT